jgi:hypothetical protein
MPEDFRFFRITWLLELKIMMQKINRRFVFMIFQIPKNQRENLLQLLKELANQNVQLQVVWELQISKDQILLAVGDWDTKNIDFYSCKSAEFPKGHFELFYSINTESISKKNWIDKNWLPYQNINLFSTVENELYLIGLGQNNKNENVADLYQLKDDDEGKFSITKTASKTFNCEKEVSFKAGAGAVIDNNGNLAIVACGYNAEETSYLNYLQY